MGMFAFNQRRRHSAAAAKLAEDTKVVAAAKAADDARLAKLLEQANADEGLVLATLDTDTGRTFSEPIEVAGTGRVGNAIPVAVGDVGELTEPAVAPPKLAGRRQRG